jgi:hypothetical protein
MEEYMWEPKKKDCDGDLEVDARPAFKQPVRVKTSKREMLQLVRRLQAEGRDKQIQVSNQMFRRWARAGASKDLDPKQDEFEAFCGNVLVFYCARYLLDGRRVPCLKPATLNAPSKKYE